MTKKDSTVELTGTTWDGPTPAWANELDSVREEYNRGEGHMNLWRSAPIYEDEANCIVLESIDTRNRPYDDPTDIGRIDIRLGSADGNVVFIEPIGDRSASEVARSVAAGLLKAADALEVIQ